MRHNAPYGKLTSCFQKDLQRAIQKAGISVKPNSKVGMHHFSTSSEMFPILFRILYGCGLRKSEVLGLKKEDVDATSGIIHVNRGKNGRERIVVMSGSLQKKCAAFLEKNHNNTPEGTCFLYSKSMGPLSESTVNRGFRYFLYS